MNEKVSQWVLTDTERNIWVETLELVLWKVFYRKPGMPRRPHPADVE